MLLRQECIAAASEAKICSVTQDVRGLVAEPPKALKLRQVLSGHWVLKFHALGDRGAPNFCQLIMMSLIKGLKTSTSGSFRYPHGRIS